MAVFDYSMVSDADVEEHVRVGGRLLIGDFAQSAGGVYLNEDTCRGRLVLASLLPVSPFPCYAANLGSAEKAMQAKFLEFGKPFFPPGTRVAEERFFAAFLMVIQDEELRGKHLPDWLIKLIVEKQEEIVSAIRRYGIALPEYFQLLAMYLLEGLMALGLVQRSVREIRS